MKKFSFTLSFQRTQIIEVEAENLEAARELVVSGEFEDSNIVDTEDDYVDISEGTEISP